MRHIDEPDSNEFPWPPERLDSLEEAELLRDALKNEIIRIETQLGQPVKTHSDGSAYSAEQYQEWESGAKYALAAKKTKLITLRRWIIRERARMEARSIGVIDPEDPSEILNAWMRLSSKESRQTSHGEAGPGIVKMNGKVEGVSVSKLRRITKYYLDHIRPAVGDDDEEMVG